MDAGAEQHDLMAPVWHTDGVKACVMHELSTNAAYRNSIWLGVFCWIFCIVFLVIVTASGTLEPAEILDMGFWLMVGFVAWALVFGLMAYGFGYFRSRFQKRCAISEAESLLADIDMTDDDL
jgi:hypothetical protein